MPIQTILNRIQKHRGFVDGPVRLDTRAGRLALTIDIYPHARNRPRCSRCGRRGPQYDRLAPRAFEFVPLWGLAGYFFDLMRRVDCPTCGVRVEAVPWATGKHTVTTTSAWFLAGWANRLSWREVARTFHTTWDQVFRAVAMAVQWGRAHVVLGAIEAIGIDEIQWQHGQRYLTLVSQVDARRKRLLWIGPARRVKTRLRFFRWFGREHTQALRFVCSDLWKPSLKVIAKKASHALHMLDRFPIAMPRGEAIEAVRRAEVHDLRRQGRQPLLTKTRWLLLTRPRI